MIAVNHGIRSPKYASDCWGFHNSRSGIRCPLCGGECWIEGECRNFLTPAFTWASCRHCEVWWNLGEVESYSPAIVEAVALKRASSAFTRHYRQATLESWV